MHNPKVSVVIVTKLRESYCALCVEDLMTQNYENFEVIIIEQEVSHSSIAELAKRFAGKVSYYFVDGTNTLPYYKNIGASHATGEIILFLDDDCRVPEDFLSKAVKVFLSDPVLGGLSPKIIQPYVTLEKAPEGVVGQVSRYGKITANYGSDTATSIQVVHRCSFFLKKAFDEVAGFDSHFKGDATQEEADVSLRIAQKGYRFLFEPSLEFIHARATLNGGETNPHDTEFYFDFFHNDILFFLKNLKWQWMPIFFLSRIRPMIACMFYYGKAKPQALTLPFRAYVAGYKTHKLEERSV
jgi:GT2 family glycosyltransferase